MTKIEKEKIVDYAFEKDGKSNVLAIHPSRPLIAYLINIQRTPKITKGWSGGNEPQSASQINGRQSSNSSIISSSINNGPTTTTTTTTNHSIRIIDYDTRQRCLAKGIYHARPADCVFTINSLICSQNDIIKLAVVDKAANIYLYDLAYLMSGLTATRIAVIRGPGSDVSPFQSIVLVWCPFVPCEDFEDGDGGLRLALATDSKIEIFAIDRIIGKTGEMQRNDLKGAYKCIQDVHDTNVVTLSISPDCSTISAASHDNRVTFYSSDIEDSGQRCLHNWTASIMDGSPISKLFFLDDYPMLLEDSTMKFWGAAFIGTKSGEIILVNLRNWTVYQRINIQTHSSATTKNFDYKIDSTSRNIVAMNGNQCYIVQIEHSHTDPKAKVSSPLPLGSNSIYSFVIKHATDDELHLFTISAYSLERYIIDLESLEPLLLQPVPSTVPRNNNINAPTNDPQVLLATSQHLQQQEASRKLAELMGPAASIASSMPTLKPTTALNHQLLEQQQLQQTTTIPTAGNFVAPNIATGVNNQLDISKIDRVLDNLFSQINVAFHAGLKEFFNDIKCEMDDLNSKVIGLSRDVRKLNQQLQEVSRQTKMDY